MERLLMKQAAEIKLTRENIGGHWHSKCSDYHHISVCDSAFRRVITVPRGAKTAYAVFTKTDTHPDGTLTLKSPGPVARGVPRLGGVEESNASLMWSTRRRLASMYDKGYRFVRIEFDA